MVLEDLHSDWLLKRNAIEKWNEIYTKDCLRIWNSICLPLSVHAKTNVLVHKDLHADTLKEFLDNAFDFLCAAHNNKTFNKKGAKRRAEIRNQFYAISKSLFLETGWQEFKWKIQSGRARKRTMWRVFPKTTHYFQDPGAKCLPNVERNGQTRQKIAEKIVHKYGFLSIHFDGSFECEENLQQLDEALALVAEKLKLPEGILGLGASLVFRNNFRKNMLGSADDYSIAIHKKSGRTNFLETFFHEWTHFLERSILREYFTGNSTWGSLYPLLSNLQKSALRRSVQIPKIDTFLRVYEWMEEDLVLLKVEQTPDVKNQLNQFVVDYIKSAKSLDQENKKQLEEKYINFLSKYSQNVPQNILKNAKILPEAVLELRNLQKDIEKNKNKKSVYAINSLFLDKQTKEVYLSKPGELLARSGEMFFGQMLNNKRWQSAQTITQPQIYPHALDRIQIVIAFERLLDQMKEMPSLLDVRVSPPVVARKFKR